MKITVEHEGKVFEYLDVSDACLCMVKVEPITNGSDLFVSTQNKTHTFGNNFREMVKELRQATIDLQSLIPPITITKV